FLEEARIVASLQHPNIVQIYDCGEEQGSVYCCLEYAAGGNLAEKAAGRAQPPDQAAALVETLARAMHHVHERGIVHRDLKPGNILLTEEDVPKVADFGLARRGPGVGQTASGTVMGSAAYMAPEQARGDSNKAGVPADVYALGAILY